MRKILIFLLLFSCISLLTTHSFLQGTKKMLDLNVAYAKETDESSINIINSTDATEQEVQTFVTQAKEVVRQEQNNNMRLFSSDDEQKSSDVKQATYETVDYYKIDTDKLFFYEDSRLEKPVLKVIPLNSQQNLATTSNNAIPDGIGGRVFVSSTTGSYIEARVSNINLKNIQGSPYIYTGLNYKNFSVDAGIAYSPNDFPGVWQPYLKIGGAAPLGTSYLLKGYNSVQNSNGYLSSEPIQIDFWRNYSSSTTNEQNAIRVKLVGTAVCTDLSCSHRANTKLTSIFSKSNTGLEKIDNYKILATLAGASPSGQLNATVSDITVDGVAKAPIKNATDYTSVDISGNTVNYRISK